MSLFWSSVVTPTAKDERLDYFRLEQFLCCRGQKNQMSFTTTFRITLWGSHMGRWKNLVCVCVCSSKAWRNVWVSYRTKHRIVSILGKQVDVATADTWKVCVFVNHGTHTHRTLCMYTVCVCTYKTSGTPHHPLHHWNQLHLHFTAVRGEVT